MKFSLRLMRRREPFGQQSEEAEALRHILSRAPGVADVGSIDLHRRGGYIALMDFDRKELDAFINYIEGERWMSVF